MFSFRSISAKPMTPRPIFRVSRVFSRMMSRGKRLASMTLSRKCTALADHLAQGRVVDLAACDDLGQVQGPEVAGLVGQERLLAAGVGGFDLPQVGDGVAPVEGVQEDDAGLAGGPGALDDEVEEPGGAHLLDLPAGAGVGQGEVPVFLDRLHEGVGQAHGDVEVGEALGVVLTGDEGLDIRVVHPEDPHVGAPAGAALLDGFGGHVEDVHEGDGAGGHPLGGEHRVVGGPDVGEGKAGAAAGLVDEGGLFHRVEDALDVIVHRQDEAGGELAQLPAGVHQGGGVGHKLERRHEVVEFLGRGGHVRLGVVEPVDGGDGVGHPPEHVRGGFGGLPGFVLLEVALFQHYLGVVA